AKLLVRWIWRAAVGTGLRVFAGVLGGLRGRLLGIERVDEVGQVIHAGGSFSGWADDPRKSLAPATAATTTGGLVVIAVFGGFRGLVVGIVLGLPFEIFVAFDADMLDAVDVDA